MVTTHTHLEMDYYIPRYRYIHIVLSVPLGSTPAARMVVPR